jgi:cytochrome c-type biogenesis protein CcmI
VKNCDPAWFVQNESALRLACRTGAGPAARDPHADRQEGKTDKEILDFMVARYGDFVRYRPPVKPTTWLLWGGPFLLLGGGVGGAGRLPAAAHEGKCRASAFRGRTPPRRGLAGPTQIMTYFYLAAAALVVVALALLLRPWWRSGRRTVGADFLPALNAAIHRDRLAELERDHRNGTLSAAGLAEAREELQRQLLDDTAAAEVCHRRCRQPQAAVSRSPSCCRCSRSPCMP